MFTIKKRAFYCREDSTLNDYLLLQSDINAVVNWCELNNLQLNIKNVKLLHSTEQWIVLFNYEITSIKLVRPNSIKYLGVILDRKHFMNMLLFLNQWRYLDF